MIKRSKYKYIKTRTLSQADGQGGKKQQIPCLLYEEGIFIYGGKIPGLWHVICVTVFNSKNRGPEKQPGPAGNG
jgi:hypothetical protein